MTISLHHSLILRAVGEQKRDWARVEPGLQVIQPEFRSDFDKPDDPVEVTVPGWVQVISLWHYEWPILRREPNSLSWRRWKYDWTTFRTTDPNQEELHEIKRELDEELGLSEDVLRFYPDLSERPSWLSRLISWLRQPVYDELPRRLLPRATVVE